MNRLVLSGGKEIDIADMCFMHEIHVSQIPRIDSDAAAELVAARLIACARLDDLRGCREMLATYWRNHHLRAPVQLTRETRASLELNAAEAWCALGEPVGATMHATRAFHLDVSSAVRLRACSLLALGNGLRGDLVSAREYLDICRTSTGDAPWACASSYTLALAHILVATLARAPHDLLRVADALGSEPDAQDFELYAAEVARAQAYVCLGDLDSAIPVAVGLLSSGASRGQAMVRALLVSVYADALLVRGEPRRVLAFLDGLEGTPDYARVRDIRRAYAHSLLYQDREVLRVTQEYMDRLGGHDPRAFIPLMMVRGLAFHRLNDEVRAKRHISDGLRVALRAGAPLAPFSGLAATDFLPTLRYARKISAEMDDYLDEIVRFLGGASGDPQLSYVPALTVRERSLARSIYRRMSNPQIALEDGVSVNTVKAQLGSLYRKLGVHGRDEAIQFLQARGFYYGAPSPYPEAHGISA
ncbi:helix-turn-helix transcriptional regulator [Microbacterium trichothecenolyticum]|nr:LuxR C-terminal-related transcriptional regulator [Microbacterium trichothecenolyticum]